MATGIENILHGKQGEAIFSTYLTDERLICYSSKEIDIFGWDFLVEDLDAKSISVGGVFTHRTDYRIQVKTTRNLNDNPTLKLSTLIDLIQQRSPTFVVMLKIDATSIEEAIVIHVGKHIIDKVLIEREIALRTGIKPNDKDVPIDRHLGVRFKPGKQNFRQIFQTLTDEFPEPYANNKLEYANSHGSPGRYELVKILDFSKPYKERKIDPRDQERLDASPSNVYQLFLDGQLPFKTCDFVFRNQFARVTFECVAAYRTAKSLDVVEYEFRHKMFTCSVTEDTATINWNWFEDANLKDLLKMIRASILLSRDDAEAFFSFDEDRTDVKEGFTDGISAGAAQIHAFAESFFTAILKLDLDRTPVCNIQMLAAAFASDSHFRKFAMHGGKLKTRSALDGGFRRFRFTRFYLIGSIHYLEDWDFFAEIPNDISAGTEIDFEPGKLTHVRAYERLTDIPELDQYEDSYDYIDMLLPRKRH
jgi:hypothetical protein